MGNASSSSGADRQAEWEHQVPCNCGMEHCMVVLIEKIKVPMWNDGIRVLAEVGRGAAAVATIGISTWWNGGIKDATHEAVEMLVMCQKCNKKFNMTLELSREGKHKRVGRYRIRCEVWKAENWPKTKPEPGTLCVKDVENLFDKLPAKYSAENNNCCHFAVDLYYNCEKIAARSAASKAKRDSQSAAK
jgi:hypothetical protein